MIPKHLMAKLMVNLEHIDLSGFHHYQTIAQNRDGEDSIFAEVLTDDTMTKFAIFTCVQLRGGIPLTFAVAEGKAMDALGILHQAMATVYEIYKEAVGNPNIQFFPYGASGLLTQTSISLNDFFEAPEKYITNFGDKNKGDADTIE